MDTGLFSYWRGVFPFKLLSNRTSRLKEVSKTPNARDGGSVFPRHTHRYSCIILNLGQFYNTKFSAFVSSNRWQLLVSFSK